MAVEDFFSKVDIVRAREYGLIGKHIVQYFDSGWFWGKILSYDCRQMLFRVVFSDGDQQDFDDAEISPLVADNNPFFLLM